MEFLPPLGVLPGPTMVGKHGIGRSVVTYVLAAGVAVLGVEGLEAVATVRAAVLHDVALAPQHRLTLEAAEVLHVPMPALRLGAFVSKDDLHQVQYHVY